MVVLSLFVASAIYAQDMSSIANVKVDQLSDTQVSNFWKKAQQRGYSLEQLEVMAKAKKMPIAEIEKLKSRIRDLQMKQPEVKVEKETTASEEETLDTSFGLTGKEIERKPTKSKLYGYDFFNNPKISFTPNISVATPSTYQLGVGDVLQIDLWGAAEANYKAKVNKQGNLQISGVGTFPVSGLSMDIATSKIKSYLRRRYAGIDAPNGSYNKVYVGVSLAKIRTVQVDLIGELKVPGTYSLNALSTVLNALYAAGGPTENGTFREVELIRGGQKIATFDIYDYLTKGKSDGNLQLQNQDLIIVKPYQNLVTIDGEVKRPGIYELKEGETMQNLIDYCRGFTPSAYKDIIVVGRVNGRNREVKEILYSQASQFLLKGGDKITIQKIVDKYDNKVTIEGAVYHAGNYELKPKMTLKDLIDKASGVKEEAFLDRALLIRKNEDNSEKILSFAIPAVLNGSENMALQANDKVIIYDKNTLREKRYIKVNGAVNTPKTLDYMEGMTVEDVIVLAGGLKEGADASNVEVSRHLKDDKFETVGESFTISTMEKSERTFELQPYDIVSVRYIKGYTKQKSVRVKGEVLYPGVYAITTKNERISELIKRVGGLTPYAYVEGATLIRKREVKEDKLQKEVLSDLIKQDEKVSDLNIKIKKEQRVGIHLKEILSDKDSEYDLVLQEGDELVIPTGKQTVEVQGRVFSPSLVQYIPGKSLKYYIANAGGFDDEANKEKTYVIYPNGSIGTTSSFLGIKSYPKVLPGSVIVVPVKQESKSKISVQEILGITTSLATIALLVNQLVKK